MTVQSSSRSPSVIQVQNISKRYQIGSFDRLTFRREIAASLNQLVGRFKAKVTGGEIPATADNYFWALKDVSFEVRKGEVFGIIGKNGSGKSTLLKILSRITKPTSGKATIDEHVVSLLEVGTGFHPELTGRENIYLSGTIIGLKKNDIDRKFDEIVDFSGIGEFIDTPVKRYSSGMYVRLAFAVSTQLVSEVILIDEVLAVGDAEFQRKSLAKIDELHQRGKTIILVSHYLFPLEQLCDRVMWLDGGRIKKIDSYKVVAEDYLNSETTPPGIIEFLGKNGAHGAHLIKVFTSCEGQMTAEVPYNKPITITIDYHIDTFIDNLKIGCRVWNNMNAPILNTTTSDPACTDHRHLGEPGQKSVSVEIPKHWLAPADYYLEIGIWSPDVEHHHHVIKALSFKVISSDIEPNTPEEFRPHLTWYAT
jgi:homopolymeric O-antigen transport system ATP-binding protein